jgi:hypothetical protein
VKAVCYKRNRSKQQTADDFSDHHEPAEPDDCPGLALALFVPCGKRPGGYSRAWEAGEAQPPSIPGNAAQMNGSGTCTGFAIGPRAGYAEYTGNYNLTLTPAIITAATPSVAVDGTITNFFNANACNVTFEGAYVHKID